MENPESTPYKPPLWTPKFINVEDLQENPKNPKIISEVGRKRLRQSLDRFGLAGTTIANTDLMIIDGHSRKAELLERGIKQVWVSIPDRKLTKRDYDEMNAIFDIAKAGEPDLMLMEETLGAEFFLDWDLNSGVKPTAAQDTYEIPAEIETGIVVGDLIEIGPHRLVCGDSTDAKSVENLLAGKEPYLMISDPPYGVEYDPTWRHKAGINNSGRQGKVQNDDRADWSEAWKLSPSKVAYIWHGGKHSATVQQSLEKCDFEMRAQIIWNKQQMVFSRGDYHWKHEPCWYAVRKGCKGNWGGGSQADNRLGYPIHPAVQQARGGRPSRLSRNPEAGGMHGSPNRQPRRGCLRSVPGFRHNDGCRPPVGQAMLRCRTGAEILPDHR